MGIYADKCLGENRAVTLLTKRLGVMEHSHMAHACITTIWKRKDVCVHVAVIEHSTNHRSERNVHGHK